MAILSPQVDLYFVECVCNSYCSHLFPSTALHLITTQRCNTQLAHFTLAKSAQMSGLCLPPPRQLLWEQVLYGFLYSWPDTYTCRLSACPSSCPSLLSAVSRETREVVREQSSTNPRLNIWLQVRCNLVHRRQKIYFYLKCQLSL